MPLYQHTIAIKHMWYTLLILIIFGCNIGKNTVSQANEEDLFQTKLKQMGMTFVPPKGFINIEPIQNTVMNYNVAYKHPNIDLEVRYAIRAHAGDSFRLPFEMTLENISGKFEKDYTVFKPLAAKQEFNADGGGTCMLAPLEAFGGDYTYCLVVNMFKKGKGEGYVFYLTHDNTLLGEHMKPIFYNLAFKSKK